VSGAQHTPGPWSLTIDPYEDVDPPSEPFCTITAGNGGYMGESGFELSGICCEADARLIAAAPQLYEALGHIRELLVAYGPRYIDKAVKLADDALAKARGETA
jgi:hypothetical protein